MSISALEKGLQAFIKASDLNNYLRTVGTLPDLDDQTLVDRFATDAPAVYVSYVTGVGNEGSIKRRFGIAVVTRNARGHDEARHGDGVTIGLYEMIDAVESLIDGQNVAEAGWTVRTDREIKSKLMFKAGLYGAVIDIETELTIDHGVDLSTLSGFITYHAEHSMADGSAEPTAIDEITLPQ